MGEQKRIEYIDTLKGICICLVSLTHAYIYNAPENHYFSFALMLRMPLYFFVCGFFYSSYNSSFKTLLLKKTNKLIIPSVAFSLINFLFLAPLLWDEWVEIGWLWTPGFFYKALVASGPIWFLRCLFFMYIFYFVITDVLCKNLSLWATDVIIFSLGFISWCINRQVVEYIDSVAVVKAIFHLNINVALIVLPIMRAAIRLKPILLKENNKNKEIVAIIVCFVMWIVMRLLAGDISFVRGILGENYLFAIIGSISAVICVWLIVKRIKFIPLVTYMGKYSLIVLCCHMLVIRYCYDFITTNNYLLVAITFISSFPIIYIFITYLPYISAQKDMLIIKDNYITIKFSRFTKKLWKFQ